MRHIFYSSKFKKSLRRIPVFVQQAFLQKESLFLDNPFSPALETHKLHGKYNDFWAFRVIGQYRVMFRFMENGKDIGFINIGTHEIYR